MGRAISAFKDLAADGLPPRQERVALALASGRSVREAARACHAGETTVKRWLATSAFVCRVVEIRHEMTSAALGRLVIAMTVATDTLLVLCRKGRSESVRLGAARAILELGQRLREGVEMEARIAALEASSRTSGRAVG
jgi:hypothetical protein